MKVKGLSGGLVNRSCSSCIGDPTYKNKPYKIELKFNILSMLSMGTTSKRKINKVIIVKPESVPDLPYS